MKIFLVTIVVILALVVWLIFSPLIINAEYRNKKLKLVLRCAFLRYTVNDSAFRKKEKKTKEGKTPEKDNGSESDKSFMGKISKWGKGYGDASEVLAEILDLVKYRAEFYDIYLRLRYGSGDAAATGILYGGIWTVIGSAYSYLCRYFSIEFPKVELEPVFNEKVFDIEAQGIIKTRLVHIIRCVLKILKKQIIRKKQGKVRQEKSPA